MCGTTGDSICTSPFTYSMLTLSCLYASFTKTIIAEIAVLKCKFSKSSVTFLTIMWYDFSSSLVSSSTIEGFTLPSSSIISLQTRSRKRRDPSTPFVVQAIDASSGPMNISYSLNVSAPCVWLISSGLTTLPLDLDIFSLPSPKIIPWLNSFWNGSFVGTTPIS